MSKSLTSGLTGSAESKAPRRAENLHRPMKKTPPSVVECLDDVDARFRALRTFIEMLGWCSEMPSFGHVDSTTIGETSSLMMGELLEMQDAMERLKKVIRK